MNEENELRYAFYLGCFAPLFTKQYELSTRKVAEKLGIEPIDLREVGSSLARKE